MTAGSSLERARLLAVLANVQVHQGDLDEALPTIAAAARFAQEAGSDELVAEAHAIRGTVAYDQGHLTQAAEHYNRSVEMLRKLDKPGSVAVMTHDLALIALAGGDTTAARLLVEEAIGTARAHGFRRLEAAALGTLGYVELEADRFEEANEVLRQALAAYVSCEDFGLSVATDLYAVAAVRTLRGDPRGGRVLVRAADAYFDQIGAVPDPHARRARTRALGDGSDDCRRAESSEAEPAASLELAEAVAHARSLD